MAEGYDEPVRKRPLQGIGFRTLVLGSYDIPKLFYQTGLGRPRHNRSIVHWMGQLGALLWYADYCNRTGHKKRTLMDIDKLVSLWKEAVVGLALAHDKDEADKIEASIEPCLTPILTAPIKQVREFAGALLEALKADPRVPFLVWRAYEVWVLQMKDAPDEDVKELKRGLAQQIVDLVEDDAKAQLGEAMVRALMWRDPEKLDQVKQVVEREKAAGRQVRLRGRESCLFLEAGGTEAEPQVCIQV